MRKLAILCLMLLVGCSPSGPPPRVAPWAMGPLPADEVNLLLLGDWGDGSVRQQQVARGMAAYVAAGGVQYHAALTMGDNFYLGIRGIDDSRWQTLFEDCYDASKLNFPFYVTLGNHDYDGSRWKTQRAYAVAHPDSRWKMPGNWYRLDFPAQRPLVTVLMLDSNRGELSRQQWAEQLAWMQRELADRKAPWVVCVAHHPLFSNGVHGDNPALQQEWGELFQKYAVNLYVVGHDHDLQHLRVPGRGTYFVVCGGGGAGTRLLWGDRYSLFGRAGHGFGHLRISRDAMEMRLLDADGVELYRSSIKPVGTR